MSVPNAEDQPEIGHTTPSFVEYTPSVEAAFNDAASPSDIVRHASTWSILCGVALIVLGALAVGSPALAAVAGNAVIRRLGRPGINLSLRAVFKAQITLSFSTNTK